MPTTRRAASILSTRRTRRGAWLVAAALATGAASARAQGPCTPTATVSHPAEGGTSAALVVDGRGETFYDAANSGIPGGARPIPRLTIDFGCTRGFVRLRRRMTPDGFTISGNRGPNREAIYLSRTGFDFDRVLLSAAATSGWEAYVPSEGGWQYVSYGWSAWLTLDGPQVEARYVIFDWLDNFDALNEIEVIFGAAPANDLWVDLDGTATWFEWSGGWATEGGYHTASYGNRGSRVVTGVRLTLNLAEGTRLAAGDCDAAAPPAGWTCTQVDHAGHRCTFPTGPLASGASRSFVFMVCPLQGNDLLLHTMVTRLAIGDDGLAGTESAPFDNVATSVLGAPARCDNDLEFSECCLFEAMDCVEHPDLEGCPGTVDDQAVAPGSHRLVRSPLRWLRDTVATAIDSFEFVPLLRAVRELVFAATPGGRRATRLFEIHGQEIKVLVLSNAPLRSQVLAALDAWRANLEAMVAGRAGDVQVTAGQVASITTALAGLRAVASPALRAAIDDESAAIGIAGWAGLNGDQALAKLELLSCEPDAQTLCLGSGRFRVETFWQTPQGQTGAGNASPLTGDTGFFWFFNGANVEVVVKALDGCAVNNRKWIFAAGLTNVRVTTTVTDTQTGVVKTYVNPINTRFQPVQDTSAFATCP